MTWPNPSPRAITAIKIIVFLICLIPFSRLVIYGIYNMLGANPIEFITRSTGTWTLVFLLITLSITPIRKLLHWSWLIRLRRMLGLFAFFYGTLHFTTYIWLDQFFDWGGILQDIAKRPFITVGFISFVLMIPLAFTSTNTMVKRLGGKRWQTLHRLIYITAIAAVIHYWWLVKKDVTQPVIYASILVLLLAARLIFALEKRRPKAE